MPMGMMDPKKAATVIASSYGDLKKGNESFKGHGAGEGAVETDDTIALDAAGEEILAAVQAKDAKALVEAMKAFLDLCKTEEIETEETDEL